ncbi:unnamed protein product [Rhodiola kirilowii]
MVPDTKLRKAEGGVTICETKYIQIVGSLMYLTTTRPDIMYIVILVSRFMSKPIELHSGAAKRILRYLKGTQDYVIFYKKSEEGLVGFTTSDYVGDRSRVTRVTGGNTYHCQASLRTCRRVLRWSGESWSDA